MKLAPIFRWALLGGAVAGFSLLSASLRGDASTAPVWSVGAIVLAFALRERGWKRAIAVAYGCTIMAVIGFALGRPPFVVVGLSFANAVEIAVALLLLKTLKLPIMGARAFLRVALAAGVAAPAVSTLVAAAVHDVAIPRTLEDFSLRWFAAHALGMLVAAPMLLSLGSEPISRARAIRLAAVQAAVLFVNLYAFSRADSLPLLMIPPLVTLAVITGGETGASMAVAVTGVTAAILTASGYGPAAGSADIYVYQGFLACMALCAHALAAVMRMLASYSQDLAEPWGSPLRDIGAGGAAEPAE